jgi:pentafunctional AROM polypeptide
VDKKSAGNKKKLVLLDCIGKTHKLQASMVNDCVIAKTLCKAAKIVLGTLTKSPI